MVEIFLAWSIVNFTKLSKRNSNAEKIWKFKYRFIRNKSWNGELKIDFCVQSLPSLGHFSDKSTCYSIWNSPRASAYSPHFNVYSVVLNHFFLFCSCAWAFMRFSSHIKTSLSGAGKWLKNITLMIEHIFNEHKNIIIPIYHIILNLVNSFLGWYL